MNMFLRVRAAFNAAVLCSVFLGCVFTVAPPAEGAVGRTAGQFDVSSSGAAQYVIPLWVPPGVNKLSPLLAIAYSSHADDGLLGIGWKISGLSTIGRCNKTTAQDGAQSAPALAVSDAYCLDGNRLRYVSGTYGTAGSTYQTELETFSKVIAMGAAGNGPAWWEVWGKDGLIREYGNTVDSRIETVGSSTARAWALNKIRDRSGNYIEFIYTEDTANGSFRPSEIRYGGNSLVGTSYQTKISFVYEAINRPDPVYAFRYGDAAFAVGNITELKRLDKIDIVHAPTSTTLRTHDFAYEVLGGAGGRSRLQSIQECVGSDCLSPTNIQWINGTPGWSASAGTLGSGAPAYVGDISGDGRDDLIYNSGGASGSGTWMYSLGNATGFDTPVNTGITNWNWTDAQVIEYNGDGQADILVPCNGTTTSCVMTGSASGLAAPHDTWVQIIGTRRQTFATDVNGDGLDDLVRINTAVSPHRLGVRLRTAFGYASENANAWVAPNMFIKLSTFDFLFQITHRFFSHVRRSDFDGDGRQDFVLRLLFDNPEPGMPDEYRWVPFWGRGDSIYANANSNLGGSNPWYPGDFNGDGLTDLAQQAAGAGNWGVRYSRGGGFSNLVSGPSASGMTPSVFLITDYDGDGLSDIVLGMASSSNWGYSRSVGNGFSPIVDSGVAHTSISSKVVDANGDGLFEFAGTPPSGTLTYRLHQGVFPDLVDRVTDGYGAYVDFNYTPLTDGGATYTKGSGAVYPVLDYQGPSNVVSSYSANSGAAGTYTVTYGYEQARYHALGRGSLGFGKRKVTDSRNGVRIEQSYLQDPVEYQSIGLVSLLQVKQGGGTLIREEANTWGKKIYNASPNERRYPFLSQKITKTYEVGGAYNGTQLTLVTVTNTVDAVSGLVLTSTTTTQETSGANGINPLATHTQQVQHDAFSNDLVNWCLGKPTRTYQIASHTLPGGTQLTQQTDRSWDGAKCRLTQQVIEPLSSQWKVTHDYGYDDDAGNPANDFGQLTTATITPVGQVARTVTIAWDTTGRYPLSVTNPEGHATQYGWYVDRGLLNTETDANSLAITFQYDNFNRKTREQQPSGTATDYVLLACTSGNAYCSTGQSDLRWQLQEIARDASNSAIRTDYSLMDGFGRQRYEYKQTLTGIYSGVVRQYDAFGRLQSKSMPFFPTDPLWYESYTYDLLNRVTLIQRPVSESDSSTHTTQISYLGLTSTEVDALNHNVTKKYAATGQILQEIDHLGSDTDFEYDSFGNVLKARDVLGNELSMTYNIRGMMMSSSDPDRGSWSYDYYPLGELKNQTDAKGQVATFTYDKLSRPLTRVESEGTTTWTWGNGPSLKNIGHLYSVTSPGGYSETYGYDAYSRFSQVSVVADGATYTIDQSYHPVTGLVDTVSYPTSPGARFKVRYNYQYGVPQSTQQFISDIPGTVYWQATATNARGQIIDELRANGLQTITGYDRITGLIDSLSSGPSATATRQDLSYTWDKVGNLTQRQDANLSLTEAFTYDALNRLDYSQLNGVTNMDLSYDVIGNITSKTGVGSYTYHSTKKHAVVAAGANSYSYDANGNMNVRNGASIVWSSYNLPTTINQGGGAYSVLEYGADRSRYKQVSSDGSAVETRICIKGLFEKVTRFGITEYKHYIYGGDELVAFYTRRSTGVNDNLYVSDDHLGSTDILTTGGTNVYVRNSYDAFGKRRNGGTWSGNPSPADYTQIGNSTHRGFTGHEHLDDLSLIHMNGRVFDPVIARFISADPLVDPQHGAQGLNRYSYVTNRPLSFTDPSGLQSYQYRDGAFSPGGSDSITVSGRREGLGGGLGGMGLGENFFRGNYALPGRKPGNLEGEAVDEIVVTAPKPKPIDEDAASDEDDSDLNPWVAAAATTGVLVADDATGVGVADDLLIPVVVVTAAAIDLKLRTYVTYTLVNRATGQIYVGRASGFGSPEGIVSRRYWGHHMKLLGFTDPQLDEQAQGIIGKAAIRGREQQLMDYYGGVGGPDLANLIRGVSRANFAGYGYWELSNEFFGHLAEFTGWVGPRD